MPTLNPPKLTPMMKQYYEAKRACPEALLLFRMGDFYELFHDDARVAARVLGLALTSRERGENRMPMAGFPHHQLDSYIAKLISAGYRAAVCEQMEDPKKAKGLVKREVTRIVTAGTVTDETLLDPKESNFLAAVCFDPKTPQLEVGLAWVELSTGAFFAATVPQKVLGEQIARIAPSEIIYSDREPVELPPSDGISATIQRTSRPDWTFGFRSAYELLLKQFGTKTLEGFGFGGLNNNSNDVPAIRAAGAILDYLNETQRQTSMQIDSITAFRLGTQMEIDQASRRSLEITRTIRGERRAGSLLAVLDRCITPMGSRLLADWVAGPLTDISAINARLDAVEEFYRDDVTVADLRENLKRIYDLQRILTRVLQGRGTPRDLGMVGRTLRVFPSFRDKLAQCQSGLIGTLRASVDPCEDLADLLQNALEDEIPNHAKDGGFIRGGFDAKLDALRDLQNGGKEWIARYQAGEIERSGIPTLKVGFTRVFGYYIEITNIHREKIPANYIRKQTVKNAERYITPELKEYEEKVLTAAERANALEYELFEKLREQVCARRQSMQRSAAALAHLDVLVALAALARERGYCRPVLVEEPVMKILDGRHPVLDALEPAGTFVPNDTLLGDIGSQELEVGRKAKEGESHESEANVSSPSSHLQTPHFSSGMIQLITGPNMAGKSTFIRQTALLVVMAQIGSFLPAREATIGICDRVFARVGASDEISRGQSTFMVEMTETARILNQASPKSLVILDEIGRGTSTYDGISLAWAIVEYLHDRIECRTLFATHYHELTDLAGSFDRICNLNVAVREQNDDVAFLHKIVPGAADKSYGIHVARLAGVPKAVISRANEILDELERNHVRAASVSMLVRRDPLTGTPRRGTMQFSLFGPEDHPIVEEIRELDLDEMRPLDALKLLAEWKEMLKTAGKRR